MQSERRQEVAKAKLKKARQQLNAQAGQPQTPAGGSVPMTPLAQMVSTPATPPILTPPPANVNFGGLTVETLSLNSRNSRNKTSQNQVTWNTTILDNQMV